jgi:hypothetical protein
VASAQPAGPLESAAQHRCHHEAPITWPGSGERRCWSASTQAGCVRQAGSPARGRRTRRSDPPACGRGRTLDVRGQHCCRQGSVVLGRGARGRLRGSARGDRRVESVASTSKSKERACVDDGLHARLATGPDRPAAHGRVGRRWDPVREVPRVPLCEADARVRLRQRRRAGHARGAGQISASSFTTNSFPTVRMPRLIGGMWPRLGSAASWQPHYARRPDAPSRAERAKRWPLTARARPCSGYTGAQLRPVWSRWLVAANGRPCSTTKP